jgi:hypothetical protein
MNGDTAIDMSKIGPTFSKELRDAGLAGVPVTWGEDGKLEFGAGATPEQRAAVQAVVGAHDPGAQPSKAIASPRAS